MKGRNDKIMYFERKKYVKIRDFWFENNRNKEAEKGADFAEYHDLTEIPADRNGFLGKAERITLISDLTEDEDIMQSAFRKNTRYEIRRAAKEGCVAAFYDTSVMKEQDNLIRTINREHARLFAAKGVKVKDEYAFMRSAAEKNMLIVSAASLPNGTECVYHVYVAGNGTARLLHAVSVYRDVTSGEERNAIARANRFLHFEDMRKLKALRYENYDWGGYSQKEEFRTISDFKMSFGGRKTTVYTVFYATSLLGKLTSGLARRFRLKGFTDE